MRILLLYLRVDHKYLHLIVQDQDLAVTPLQGKAGMMKSGLVLVLQKWMEKLLSFVDKQDEQPMIMVVEMVLGLVCSIAHCFL